MEHPPLHQSPIVYFQSSSVRAGIQAPPQYRYFHSSQVLENQEQAEHEVEQSEFSIE